ncbi:MAG: hypothetical protein JW915_20175 [Chitinispirillaceae bacterium]|nr:hypothetical protein [Chitinispirillaceae bacterium]
MENFFGENEDEMCSYDPGADSSSTMSSYDPGADSSSTMGSYDPGADSSSTMSSYDPGADSSPNMCSYDPDANASGANASYPPEESNSDYFYPNPYEQNMTMADGSNQGSYPGDQNGSYDNDTCFDPYSPYYDYDAEMSIDPAMSSNNSAMVCSDTENNSNNPYASFGSANGEQCSYDPAMSSLSDIPVCPHLVLDSLDEDTSSGDYPFLDVLAIGSDGSQSGFDMSIQPDKTGRIYWSASNATHVQINGESVQLNGETEISFDKTYLDSYVPYEIVAWNKKPENSVIIVVNARMLKDTLGITIDFNKKVTIPFGKEKSYKYIKMTQSELELEFSGKYTPIKGQYPTSIAWDNDGIAAQETILQLKKSLSFCDLKLDIKGKLKTPLDITGDNDKAKESWAEISCSADGYAVFKINGSNEVNIGLKFGFTGVKISRKAVPDAQWQYKFGTVELTPFGAWKGIIKTEYGEFNGGFKISAKFKGEPNWPAIIETLVEKFGTNLGLESGTGALGIAAGIATSPAVIASGVVATIVVGCIKIVEANEAAEFRKHVIPGLCNELRKGIDDGLRGRASNTSSVTVVDEATAYQAGVVAGTKKRAELEQNCEPFNGKPEEDKNAIVNNARNSAEAKMQIDFFTTMAPGIKGRWLSSDHDKMTSLMSAWNNTIGNCPARKGGNYLNIWQANRIDNPDLKYYSGSW